MVWYVWTHGYLSRVEWRKHYIGKCNSSIPCHIHSGVPHQDALKGLASEKKERKEHPLVVTVLFLSICMLWCCIHDYLDPTSHFPTCSRDLSRSPCCCFNLSLSSIFMSSLCSFFFLNKSILLRLWYHIATSFSCYCRHQKNHYLWLWFFDF